MVALLLYQTAPVGSWVTRAQACSRLAPHVRVIALTRLHLVVKAGAGWRRHHLLSGLHCGTDFLGIELLKLTGVGCFLGHISFIADHFVDTIAEIFSIVEGVGVLGDSVLTSW